MTIHEFIEKHRITMVSVPAACNPHMPDDKDMNHWTCDLELGSPVRSLRTPFSQGIGCLQYRAVSIGEVIGRGMQGFVQSLPDYKVGGKVPSGFRPRTLAQQEIFELATEPALPDVATVLNCLASDSRGYDNARGFEDWANNYGYDTDSRRAEAAYRVTGEQSKRLRYFLGAANYAELLDCEPL